MNLSKLSAILANEPKYRFVQVNQAVFQNYISSWDEVSNLPKNLREKLTAECPLEIKAEIYRTAGRQPSEKALLTLSDGEVVETVLIRQKDRRHTVCVSSQIGCALGCLFCATGNFGFRRNLSAEEIVEQVIFWQRYLKAEDQSVENQDKVDNVVFMGMGEPFLNYPQFIKAAKFLNNPETMNIGSRRLSVSTAGLTEGIKRLAGEKLQINLAVSLHAPNDNLRRDLMPIAKKYSLRDILAAVDQYINKTNRRVMFEYLMIKEVNDNEKDALELAALMKKPLYIVNLIPYNPTGRFAPSTRERIDKFKKILEDNGVAVTVRLSFGADIAAACGQLRGKKG
jgi:23S rRNA (adenine2503-C2)-methyltransferase